MKVEFIKSANLYQAIEEVKSLGEVCFFGRSNVGKSSLINSLFNCNAFTSKVAGKTVSLNFYSLDKFTIVDSPGYGFAKGNMGDGWAVLGGDYLKYRIPLKMCFVLIDARRGLMDVDLDMIEFIEFYKTKYTIIYTKIDKLNKYEIEETVKKDCDILSEMNLKFLLKPDNGFYQTSSSKRTNIISLAGFVRFILSQK